MTVDIINKSKNPNPEYKTSGSAGFDIMANLDEPKTLLPGERLIVPTGLYVSIPNGYELQVRSRSGLAANNGIMVLNSPGTIDSDFRGEIKVILYNSSNTWQMVINNGDRIAQGVVNKIEQVTFNNVTELETTERGINGFGSTGI